MTKILHNLKYARKTCNLKQMYSDRKYWLAESEKKCNHKYYVTSDDYIGDGFSCTTIVPVMLTNDMLNVSRDLTQKGDEVFLTNYFTEADCTYSLIISTIYKNITL